MIPAALDSQVYQDVRKERFRQERLCAEGKFSWTLAEAGPTAVQRLAPLAEEFGEVAKEVCDDGPGLREELIQLAACCVAWVEFLDAYSDEEIAEREAAIRPV